MTAGSALWSGISAVSPVIYEAALMTLREAPMVLPTVTFFGDELGLNLRKVSTYPALAPESVAEGAALTSQVFDKTLLSTITPGRHGIAVRVSDERIFSDDDNARVSLGIEMGLSMSNYIDQLLTANFAAYTGGTTGTAGSTLTWNNIVAAKSKLRQANVGGPLYCVLGHGQFYHLYTQLNNTSGAFQYAPEFQDRMVRDFFVSPIMGDVTFIVTDNIANSGGTAGTAAMYARSAQAYDQRGGGMAIEFQREALNAAWDAVLNVWFGEGAWRPATGHILLGTDVIP
jgi:hypothetical protein